MRVSRHEDLKLTVPRPVPEDWRDRLLAHLLRLSPGSRRNRFFVWMSDAALARHAARTAPAVIVEARIGGEMRGMAEVHLGRGACADAEIAVSVEDDWQRRGIGAALVAQAIREARHRCAATVTLHFLPENAAMRKIALRAGFACLPQGEPMLVQARLLLGAGGATPARLH